MEICYRMFILTIYWILYIIAVHSSQVETENSSIYGENSAMYDGAQVWEVKLRGSEDMELIRGLMDDQEVSIWKISPKQALILVQMDNKIKVNRKLSAEGLRHSVRIMDVQLRIDEQSSRPDVWDKNTLRIGHRMNWHKYPTLEVVNEYMDYLVKNYPAVCKQEIIGKSAENVTIKVVSNGNPRNKGILLLSGTHAREWIAITSALSILREIVTKFDEQPKYVQDKDWHVIPLLNPDGFRYTHKQDRFWRKNRSKNYNSHCKGVDINRNFGSDWDIPGVRETNPCKETYSGSSAFSEPESKALRNTVQKLRSRLVAMVDFHAFGQIILFPWSAKSRASPDNRLLNATARGMRAEILNFKKQRYSTGQTYHLIYPASGSILDWVYSMGIRHSYVIEGRDRGENGFLIPPTYIQEAGHEMLVAVRYLASIIDKKASNRARADSWF